MSEVVAWVPFAVAVAVALVQLQLVVGEWYSLVRAEAQTEVELMRKPMMGNGLQCEKNERCLCPFILHRHKTQTSHLFSFPLFFAHF